MSAKALLLILLLLGVTEKVNLQLVLTTAALAGKIINKKKEFFVGFQESSEILKIFLLISKKTWSIIQKQPTEVFCKKRCS